MEQQIQKQSYMKENILLVKLKRVFLYNNTKIQQGTSTGYELQENE